MSKDKAKTYYVHDIDNEMLINHLELEDVKSLIEMHFSESVIGEDYNIFEYGLFEERGIGYKLHEKYNVNAKFKIENKKLTFIGL